MRKLSRLGLISAVSRSNLKISRSKLSWLHRGSSLWNDPAFFTRIISGRKRKLAVIVRPMYVQRSVNQPKTYHIFFAITLWWKTFPVSKRHFAKYSWLNRTQINIFFLWLKNIFVNDFSLKAYKNTKLTFGLKCSPTILLAALFNLLVIDVDKDNEKNLLVKELFQNEMIFTQCILRHYELFKDPQEKSLNITISSSHQFRSRIVYLLLRKWLTSTRQILCQRRALNQANHHNPFFIPYL